MLNLQILLADISKYIFYILLSSHKLLLSGGVDWWRVEWQSSRPRRVFRGAEVWRNNFGGWGRINRGPI